MIAKVFLGQVGSKFCTWPSNLSPAISLYIYEQLIYIYIQRYCLAGRGLYEQLLSLSFSVFSASLGFSVFTGSTA